MDQLVQETGAVGPMDVDRAGELAPKVNSANKGHELIQHVRDSHPIELIKLQQRPEDLGRSKGLDHAEVLDAVSEAFGGEDEKGGVVRLLSARVRGKDRPLDDIAVVVLWETPSERTARGAIAYEPLENSIRAYERGIADGSIIEHLEEDGGEDTALLKRTANRQAEQIERLSKQLEEAKEGGGDKPPADEGDDAPPAGISPEVQAALDELREQNAQLQEQLAEAQAAEPTVPANEDAADGTGDGSQTGAEAEAEAAAAASEPETPAEPPAPEPVEAPEGNAKDLIAHMGDYTDEQIEAIIANETRSSVVTKANSVKRSRAEG